MRFLAVCAAIALVAGCAARTEPGVAPMPASGVPTVSNENLVDQAKAQGKAGVGVIVSTVEGKTDDVAAALSALGGYVESSDPKIGYLRVRLPVNAMAEAKKIPSITAMDVEGLVDRVEPK